MVWVRVDAYLDTKPDKSEHTRRKSWGAPLPKKGALSYLLDVFYETGMIVSGEGGQLRALNWADLAGYMAATQQKLEPWESKALIDMSITYLGEHFRAKDPTALAPY